MANKTERGGESLAEALAILRQRFGERFSAAEAVRRHHAHTMTWLPPELPDAVVEVASTEEVAAIVEVAARCRVPLIPFGVGSSLEGHVNAPAGGISIDFSRMNRILSVHEADLDCVVEPGVTRKQLNEHLRDRGLFFPIDPGADATLGGMAATRASGTNAVRYGTMRENVLNITAVFADGSVVKTAQRARKSSAGYDLTRLLVGSEGTLGIITELTLRLHGIPPAISAGHCSFPSVTEACDAVIRTIQMGIPVARIELLDALQVKACNAYSKLTLPERPLLLVEFHGTEEGVKEQAALFGEIVGEFGGGDFAWATRQEDRNRLWQARHDGYYAARALRPGSDAVATDVCVPISRLAECVEETVRDLAETGLVAPIVGHAGDGNFHLQILVAGEEEQRTADAFIGRLNLRAIAMEGTCTGEHGVGEGKRKYLAGEHGAGVGVMRAIKQALDPLGIMNPGKVLPEA